MCGLAGQVDASVIDLRAVKNVSRFTNEKDAEREAGEEAGARASTPRIWTRRRAEKKRRFSHRDAGKRDRQREKEKEKKRGRAWDTPPWFTSVRESMLTSFSEPRDDPASPSSWASFHHLCSFFLDWISLFPRAPLAFSCCWFSLDSVDCVFFSLFFFIIFPVFFHSRTGTTWAAHRLIETHLGLPMKRCCW